MSGVGPFQCFPPTKGREDFVLQPQALRFWDFPLLPLVYRLIGNTQRVGQFLAGSAKVFESFVDLHTPKFLVPKVDFSTPGNRLQVVFSKTKVYLRYD